MWGVWFGGYLFLFEMGIERIMVRERGRREELICLSRVCGMKLLFNK